MSDWIGTDGAPGTRRLETYAALETNPGTRFCPLL